MKGEAALETLIFPFHLLGLSMLNSLNSSFFECLKYFPQKPSLFIGRLRLTVFQIKEMSILAQSAL
jgi:hypothetical protein